MRRPQAQAPLFVVEVASYLIFPLMSDYTSLKCLSSLFTGEEKRCQEIEQAEVMVDKLERSSNRPLLRHRLRLLLNDCERSVKNLKNYVVLPPAAAISLDDILSERLPGDKEERSRTQRLGPTSTTA